LTYPENNPALGESKIGRGLRTISGYRFVWVLVVPLATIPLLLANGTWYWLHDGEFPGESRPHNHTAWAIFQFTDLLMVVASLAALVFLIAGAPEVRRDTPRFRAWLPAAWVMLASSAAAAVALFYRLGKVPTVEAAGAFGFPQAAYLEPSLLPFLATLSYLLLAAISGYLLIWQAMAMPPGSAFGSADSKASTKWRLSRHIHR